MDDHTARRLVALNSEFYQTFAASFSATRQRLQPGVLKILKNLPVEADILDLGCGNGELAAALARRGHQGWYIGLDFSSEMIAMARQKLEAQGNHAFLQGNLAEADWAQKVRTLAEAHLGVANFDMVLAFAVLHHLPGKDLHHNTLQKIHDLLQQEGRFIQANWQFLNSPRLRQRIQPWEAMGLRAENVDPGDYLLDWRQGGHGLRYVHHFSEGELGRLAEKTGFRVVDSFYSDGEGGNLGLYQVWEVEVPGP